jgi:alkyl hydroperoxide reductase subunit F
MYDLIILGGGPAGTAASVYAARKQLKTAIITYEFGGQSIVSELIYNWIGTPEISGAKLADDLKKHTLYYKGPYLDIIEGEKISSINKNDKIFIIKTESGKEYTTKALLIATGSGRRKLEAINADKFEHKGITYCASCDGPLFQDQDVIVVGGGNAAFETSLQLLAYCKSVTLIHRSTEFRADEITIKKIQENPKFKIITNAEITKVEGEQFVSSLTYKDKLTGIENTIPSTGIFVEIGQTPNTDFVKDLIPLDQIGKIIVDPMTQMTQIEGIWAAGDCTNGKYHQNNIATGDAIKALEDAYIWIHKNK